MWFRNLCLFRLAQPLELDPDTIEHRLADQAFQPAGKLEPSSTGWVAPLGLETAPLVHTTGGYLMVCARREERILPAAVVREALDARVTEIEENTGRRIRGKARTDLRDEVVLDLLPRAFTRSQRTFAYIDPREGWLVVDAATPRKAEEITALLRKSLGTLPVTPAEVVNSPGAAMTAWLAAGDPPSGFTIGEECDLRDPGEDGGVVRVRRHDLETGEIRTHLEAGKQVTRLALAFEDRLSFVVEDNLLVKRLKFRDVVQDEAAGVQVDTDADRFDSDFAIMTLELARFIPHLTEAFGGLAETETQRDAA